MNLLLSLALTVVILLSTAAHSSALEVVFRNAATVTDRTVTLQDIADITPREQASGKLGSYEVAMSPSPGTDRELKAVSIISRLRNLPEATHVNWKGSDTVTVHRKGIHIKKEELKQIIAGYLENNMDRLPRAEFRFTSVQAPSEIILPTGRLSWTVTPSRPEILGSSSFSILFKVDGKNARNCTVRGHLEALAKVAAATVNLRKGTVILPDQVTLTRLDIAEIKEPIMALNDVIGMQVRRTIHAGRAIEQRQIEEPPVVRKGELVKIFAIKGPMRISTTGIAGHNGRTGDIIRVKNISSSKLIYCRVDAPGIVSVEF